MIVRRGSKSARAIRAAWAPSPARRMLRHPMVRAGLVVVVGIAASAALSARLAAVEQERASWGEVTRVAVVTESVAIGERVAASTELREIPVAMKPVGALSSVHAGALAKTALYKGEVVVRDRLTTDPQDRAPGAAALTLSVAVQVPLVQEGDLVDLWTVDSANLSSSRVAHNVVVLAFSDRDITVAVPRNHVAAVAAASLRPVTVSLVG